MKLKKYLPLILIVALGTFLRFFNLDKLPVSPNWDEVSHGYNAYAILKTGMDEWGRHFPLIFRAFGDYKLPVYIYLTTIPVFLFGLNVFAVRFISALAGVLAIPGIYLLTQELFPNKKLSIGKFSIPLELVTAFLLSISPWHFFISRPALEANLSLTFIIFGSYFLIRFFKNKSSLLPAALLLGLSMHTYNTARVFVPLLLVASFFIFRASLLSVIRQSKTKNFFAILIFAALSLLVVTQVISGEGAARYEKLKILSPSIVYQLGESRAGSKLPPVLAKIFINKPVFFMTSVAKNYLGYFSPSFFYQTWGAQNQFAIPGENLLTLPVYLLAILGFLIVLSSIRKSSSQFALSWLLLSPIAASLTADPPQALRPNPMIPVLVIMASLGLFFFLEKVPKKLVSLCFLIFTGWIIFSFARYFYDYNTGYKIKYSSSWQYGYEKVINYIKENGSKYDRIFITKRYGEAHIFYSFYTGLNPTMIQPGADNIRFQKSDWFWTDKIGNVYFVNDWQIPKISIATLPLESGGEIPTTRSLLITSPDHLPINAHVIDTVNFLDGTPAFIITSVP